MGMWLKFNSQADQQGVYLSNGGHRRDNHGVALKYGQDGLEVIFKKKDGKEWTAQYKMIIPKTWYHIAASWRENDGKNLSTIFSNMIHIVTLQTAYMTNDWHIL